MRPVHLALDPRGTAQLHVLAKVPRRAEPGDHDALVLLSARRPAGGRVVVRLRLGVVVTVRAPGTVVRRLVLGRLQLAGRRRVLALDIANAGNVTEQLFRVRTVLSQLSTRRRLETIVASRRELRPRSRGLLELPLRTRAHGPVEAQVVVPAEHGRPAVRRTYRLRL